MPRIPDFFLDCSFYVYDSKKSAERGERSGGSGFLVSVPSVHEGWLHVYAVTNKHVLDGGFHVLRLNSRQGKTKFIETKPECWVHHPEGDDIAALPIELDSTVVKKWYSVNAQRFITREIVDNYWVGPGDDTFLIGRLVTREGRQRNTPVVRFGNVSMLPTEPIQLEDGRDQEAFLVECGSLSGFSGSPVFVVADRTFYGAQIPKELITNANQEPESTASVTMQSIQGTFGPWLLGIDVAHVPLWKPVFSQDKVTKEKNKTDCVVDANTGIACVIPAWRLLTLLNDEDLRKQRTRDDRGIASKKDAFNV